MPEWPDVVVERVARKLCEILGEYPWDETAQTPRIAAIAHERFSQQEFREAARAALSASGLLLPQPGE